MAATLLCATVLLVPARLIAQDQLGSGQAWRFYWENDIGDGDRYYTNGLRFASSKYADSVWKRRVADHWFWRIPFGSMGPFSPCEPDGESCRLLRVTHAFGQNFYTPTDITQRIPPPGERPYGAVLYASRTLSVSGLDVAQSVEYSIGVIGPLALGENVQQGWHQLIGDEDWPSGWDTQMPFEPALSVAYRGQMRLLEVSLIDDAGLAVITPLSSVSTKVSSRRRMVDLSPRMGATLGTVFREVTGGATLRVGSNISTELVDRIAPVFMPVASTGVSTSGAADAAAGELQPGGWRRLLEAIWPDEWYGQYGHDWMVRQHNVFLDGTQLFFTPERTVERIPTVRDREIGGVMRWGQAIVALRRVRRSAEFRGSATQRFWALSISRDRRY